MSAFGKRETKEITMDEWTVWCRNDRKPDGSPGDYLKATRVSFLSEEAALVYAKAINRSREPMVLLGSTSDNIDETG